MFKFSKNIFSSSFPSPEKIRKKIPFRFDPKKIIFHAAAQIFPESQIKTIFVSAKLTPSPSPKLTQLFFKTNLNTPSYISTFSFFSSSPNFSNIPNFPNSENVPFSQNDKKEKKKSLILTNGACFPEFDFFGKRQKSMEVDLGLKSEGIGEEIGRKGEIKEISGNLPPPEKDKKARIVVLGTGWAAARFMKDLDTKMYDIVCISPRNHLVFTPLLAATCVGTLEFRSVAEPVEGIQPALSSSPDSHFFLARCTEILPESHEVKCEVDDGIHAFDNGFPFRVSYDKLVIALGAEASTFGIKGVRENAIFLREVGDAQAIRRKLLTNLMKSDIPGLPLEEKKRLVHCVVVGGGPTGVEFSGELSDFIRRDVKSKYAHVKDLVRVTLIEANEILSSFDVRLRQYATRQLQRSGVRLVHGMVKEVLENRLILNDGSEVPYGVLVWSTGVGPSQFVRSLPFQKAPGGRIGVDEFLRVPSVEDVFAIGDCSGYLESTGKSVLPALAQVAEREGKYLAKLMNTVGRAGASRAGTWDKFKEKDKLGHFVYRHLGSMATVGRYKALVDLRKSKEDRGISITGFVSWLIWRSAYLTRVVSWRNRFYVAFNWLTTFIFGRDISRI